MFLCLPQQMRQSSAPVQGRNTPGPAAHVRTHSAGGFSRQAGNPTITRDDTRTPMGVHSQKMVCLYSSNATHALFFSYTFLYFNVFEIIMCQDTCWAKYAKHLHDKYLHYYFIFKAQGLYGLDGYFQLLILCSIHVHIIAFHIYKWKSSIAFCLCFHFDHLFLYL